MNVLYVQPRTEAGRNYRSGDGTEQVWTPWWALLLQQHAQPYVDKTKLIDARTDPEWEQALADGLGDKETVVAVSVMTGHAIKDAIIASKLAKTAGATVCWGGPHPTLFADDVASLPYVDKVIQGFGAPSFGTFLRDLRRSEIGPGIVDSRGTLGSVPVVIANKPAPATGFAPALGLVENWNAYVNVDHAIGSRAINIITSEGCLRRCTYCSEPSTSGHSWLIYDVEDCVSASQHMVGLADADSVKLHDPNFLQDTERGLTFGRSFARTVGLPWAATIHPADLLNISHEDLASLSSSGLRRVLVGLESADQELVNKAGKRFQVERIPEIAMKLTTHGIAGMFTFIVGWPDADPRHYQRTIDAAFALRSIDSAHQAKIHFLEPWPGTPIHRLMQRTLQLPDLTIEEWGEVDYYFAHHPGLHDGSWESRIRSANQELSPYVEA